MAALELKKQLRERLLEFAWNAWAQIGLSGRLTDKESRAMDPEALLLFTIEVARKDPRLFDEVLDWVAANGKLLSFNRIKHLRVRHPGSTDLVDAVLAWAASENPRLPGPTIKPNPRNGSSLVFDPAVAEFNPDPDPTFAAFGFARPRVRRSRRSSPPDPRIPINFAFRLRSVFGAGTRAEVMRILLTCPESLLDASRISEQAAFAKRNVSEALLALSGAGAVNERWSGNERLFSVDRENWAQTLGLGPTADSLPGHAAWISILRALAALHVWFEHAFKENWSPYMAASEARFVTDGLSSDLAVLGMTAVRNGSARGETFWEFFEELILQLLDLAEAN